MENKERKRVYDHQYYLQNRDRILARILARNKQTNYQYLKAYKKGIKQEVLTHYGGSKLACIKCGFSDIRALTIDHIEGGGARERKRNGLLGVRFYLRLKNTGFPKGYQTLCMNCQFIKAQEKREYHGGK